jgi:hypothetical protein
MYESDAAADIHHDLPHSNDTLSRGNKRGQRLLDSIRPSTPDVSFQIKIAQGHIEEEEGSFWKISALKVRDNVFVPASRELNASLHLVFDFFGRHPSTHTDYSACKSLQLTL